MTGKIAAIWWRVSTDDQREISPDTQTGEALALAEQEGYSVPTENVIGTDWSSLSVWNSPTMGQLRALVLGRAINAIFMYDADRGPSKPAHRLMFRALCEENGVAVRCCHGEIPGGEMGELMEFISAWSKEKQVHRAQQGAKDGLRDRAKKRGLPTNGTAPLGYQFRYQDLNGKRIPVALEPDSNYPVAQMIWRLALEGCPMRRISTELSSQGIPAPKGGAYWNPSTVAGILNNPVYGGRYYSLRETAIIPVQRRKVDSYRSSAQPLPFDAWHWLEDFPVMSPVVTWDQWETVRRRLARNKTDAARNAKRTYWLRGMLFCSEDGRRLVGHFSRGIYRYECPGRRGKIGVPKCGCPNLPGPELEDRVWTEVADFLGNPDIFQAEMDRRVHGQEGQGAEAERKIADLTRRLADGDRRETELVALRLRGAVSEVALDRNAALLRVERTHLTEELERQRETMSTLEQGQAAVASLEALREHMRDRLNPRPRRGPPHCPGGPGDPRNGRS